MGKTAYKRLHGGGLFRLRLVLATLSSTPVIIDDIRSEDTAPGLLPHEISFLRLLEKISDDCLVEINETGTKLRYKPGVLLGGRHLVHDCGLSRSIDYFMEPLVMLGLFGKKPLHIRLRGITNDDRDPSVDTFRLTTLQMLERFGVPLDGLELKIESRGVPPLGGGEVVFKVPIVPESLSATNWVDEGMVKRIRGVAFSTRVSSQFVTSIVEGARSILNIPLADVHIYTDHRSGLLAGRSPGYGLSLVAETTSGCKITADDAVCYPRTDETESLDYVEEKPSLMPPDELGKKVASMLFQEIEQGGVVDSTHQGLLFLLCAVCPPDVSKVRVGKLTPYGIETLRHIRDFLGVKFDIKPDPTTNTIILICVGCDLKNLSRKIS